MAAANGRKGQGTSEASGIWNDMQSVSLWNYQSLVGRAAECSHVAKTLTLQFSRTL